MSKLKEIKKNLKKIVKQKLDDIFEYPLVEIRDQRGQQAPSEDDFLIPPVGYQTCVDNRFGKTHAKEILRFRSLNSTLDFILFDDRKMNEYMEAVWSQHLIYPIFSNAKFGPMKSDIFRYCILYEKGGYYFDINKGCRIPLRHLHSKENEGVISFETNWLGIPPDFRSLAYLQYPTKYIVQFGLGFVKRHVVLEKTIENICYYYKFLKNKVFENPREAIVMFTGPGIFTKTVRELIDKGIDPKLSQAGIDFNGQALFMEGSHIRYRTSPPYWSFKNSIIVS